MSILKPTIVKSNIEFYRKNTNLNIFYSHMSWRRRQSSSAAVYDRSYTLSTDSFSAFLLHFYSIRLVSFIDMDHNVQSTFITHSIALIDAYDLNAA